jgi:acyl carrier protein
MGDLDMVRHEILSIFAQRFHTRIASPEIDLLEGRIVDSVKIVDLVLELEQRFGVALAFEELDVEDFRTISRLAERVRRAPAASF